MTGEEFRGWLDEEAARGRMTLHQMDDLVKQQLLFVETFGSEENPRPLRQSYHMKIVGYVAEQLRVATEIHHLIDVAKRQFPNRMIYFEPIGFDLF
jgi:hypothetical protein